MSLLSASKTTTGEKKNPTGKNILIPSLSNIECLILMQKEVPLTSYIDAQGKRQIMNIISHDLRQSCC